MNRLFAVTLTDLGTYEVIIAADTAKDACSIAKCALFEEATKLPPGMAFLKRETEGSAILAEAQPVRQFDVTGSYTVDFSIRVPASNAAEAERHARRLYEAQPFPWEHAVSDDRVRWHSAREVVS